MNNGTTLRLGDCLDVLPELPTSSVDALVTDPPYHLGFMGRAWDKASPHESQLKHTRWATEALRVLKPGAHAVVFGGTRTYHRMVCGLEDAGFEIRDCLAWLYGSGFPKSWDVGNGWGTTLKPAYEPIVLARKPLQGTVTANVLWHGTGALNVDGCRLEGQPRPTGTVNPHAESGVNGIFGQDPRTDRQQRYDKNLPSGRWPANVLLDEEAAAMVDAQSGDVGGNSGGHFPRSGEGWFTGDRGGFTPTSTYQDSGGASRFFYVAKVSAEERHAGLSVPSLFSQDGPERNAHPTVKPVELMRWLCRLVTPPSGTVLDPFLGSGSTGIAAGLEGFSFIGIEREQEFIEIAQARISHWLAREVVAA